MEGQIGSEGRHGFAFPELAMTPSRYGLWAGVPQGLSLFHPEGEVSQLEMQGASTGFE